MSLILAPQLIGSALVLGPQVFTIPPNPTFPVVVIENDSPQSGANAVSICSNALLMLGAETIASFTENTKGAQVMANLYQTERDAVLRRHPWNCAVKRVVLSPDTVKPAFGYGNAFSLPGDCIRVLSVTQNLGRRSMELDFQQEGRKILADVAALNLRYMWLNTIESSWDRLLVRAMTLTMAARACYAITASTSLYGALSQELAMVMKEARGVDGQENPSETFGDYSSLLAVRG